MFSCQALVDFRHGFGRISCVFSRCRVLLVCAMAACVSLSACGEQEQKAAPSRPPAASGPAEETAGAAIPLTFPDGLRVELRLPDGVDVTTKGMRPYSWARLAMGEREIQRDFVIERLDSERAKSLLEAPRLTTYEGSDGTAVPLVNGREAGVETLDYLLFRFGSWVVAVYDYPEESEFAGSRMTERERALWARHLRGRETDDGWLVLEASPPLELAGPGWGGPPVSILLEGEDASFELGRGWCPPAGQDDRDTSDGYVHWCPGGIARAVGAAATGKRPVLEQLVAGLEISAGAE
jgi:hypothetical protein